MKEVNKAVRIAGAILTLNEDRTVRRAIESLNWVDQIYVIDSGSTDDTVAIAARAGAKILVNASDGIFLISDQRNWALENIDSEFDWVVFLDADEESTDSFAAEVRSTVAETEAVAIYAAPAFMYHGKWLRRTSGYPNWHPRVVKRNSATRFVGGVWEDFPRTVTTERISAPYLHHTNQKGISDWFEKHARYAAWEARQIIEAEQGQSGRAVRRAGARRVRYLLGPARKYASIIHLAVFRRGLLDGRAGLSYMRRIFIYELMIDAYRDELRFGSTEKAAGRS